MMRADAVTALVGLVGVIIGGLITGLSSYVVEERRQRRDSEKNREDRETRVKTAARLIELEFRVARAVLARVLREQQWERDYALPLAGWQQFRNVIAPEVKYEDWLLLVVAAEVVFTLNEEYVQRSETRLKPLEERVFDPGRLVGAAAYVTAGKNSAQYAQGANTYELKKFGRVGEDSIYVSRGAWERMLQLTEGSEGRFATAAAV